MKVIIDGHEIELRLMKDAPKDPNEFLVLYYDDMWEYPVVVKWSHIRNGFCNEQGDCIIADNMLDDQTWIRGWLPLPEATERTKEREHE